MIRSRNAAQSAQRLARAEQLHRNNWPDNLRSTPSRLLLPQTIAELQSGIVDAVAADHLPVVLRGAMHSWSPGAVQDRGTAVDLTRLVLPPIIDAGRRTVSVSGSMTLQELYALLGPHDLALRCLPTVTGVTVAGAIATGCHGASRDVGHFSDQVIAVRLVDARGRDILIDAEGCWQVVGQERRLLLDGPEPLVSARHHRGLLGAVVQVVLACRPAVDLELIEERVAESVAFGVDGAQARAFVDRNEHASMIWFVSEGQVVLRAANPTTAPRRPRSAWRRVVVDGMIRTGLASAFLRLGRHCPPLSPVFNTVASRAFPRRRALRDAWNVIQTYLPGHATKEVGLRLMEYGVPLEHLGRVITLVREETRDYAFSMPMGLRRAGDRFFVEFMWQAEYPRAVAVAQRLERRLVQVFGADALPHEGKLYWINPWPRIAAGERTSFLKLRLELDPQGVFTNDDQRRFLLGEPTPGAPGVVDGRPP